MNGPARLGLVWLAAFVIATSSSGAAQTPTSASREAPVIFQSVMSPFCPGLTLAACPSSAAVQLRSEILERLHQGDSRDVIMRDLVTRYGDRIYGAPRASGPGLLVWIVPGVIGLLLLFALRAAVRRLPPLAAPETGPLGSTAVNGPLAKRLRDELEELD